MLLHSWIRNLRLALLGQSRFSSRRRRFRETVETLELRVLPANIVVPTVSAINLSGTSPTNGGSESWTATFSAPVTGVDPTDFGLAETGSVGASLVQVTGSGSAYTVTVSGITGNGTLGLNLVDNDSIVSAGSVPLSGVGANNGNFTGQVATLDHVYPTVLSINRTNPSGDTTNASVVSFTATFSKPVTGVTSSDFTVVKTGTINTVSTQVTPVNQSVYTVTVSGITGIGTLGLSLVDSSQIRDLAGNPLSSASATASFSNQTIVSTGSGPRSVVAADLNGDGKQDLVIPNVFDNNVSILLGNGDGTFQSQQVVATGTRPYSVTVGDLNGDGKSDLVVTNSTDNTVGLLLGNGDGTFAVMQTFAAGSQPRSGAIGDVNGDGKPDLLVANYFSSTVSILLGNGDGTFQTQQTVSTQNLPKSITLGDLNGDGKPDLVVANLGSNTISLLLGNGDGTFQYQQTYNTGTNPISVVIGDVTGDGKPDLAVANYNSTSIGLLLGNGDGTFQPIESFATASHPFTVVLSDLNGDGRPDLIASYRQTNQIGILLGNGDGTFQATQTFATGRQPYSVAVADLNGDGRPDLAVANFSGSPGVSGWTASVLLANGNGNFTGQTYTLDHVSPAVQSIDRTAPSTINAPVNSVTFTATFTEPVTGVDSTDFALVKTGSIGATLTQVTQVNPLAYTVTVSGITGTGTLGLNLVDNGSIRDVAGNRLSSTNALASFGNQTTFATGVNPISVVSGDINGDGKLDLAVANEIDNSVNVMLGNGDGTFGSPQSFATGMAPVSVAMGDVNGDGKLDLMVTNQGGNTVSVLLGNGDGTFAVQQSISTGLGSVPSSLAVGDVNGDGKLDLAISNLGLDSVTVFLGNGDGTFATKKTFAAGSFPMTIMMGDVNRDGKPDLIVANNQSNNVSVLLGIGDGTFGPQQTFSAGTNPWSVATGDVNGDGNLDLAVTDDGSNSVSVLLGNGNGTFAAPQSFTTELAPRSVTVVDVNGDGNLDFIVANQHSNVLCILLGNGEGTIKARQTIDTDNGPVSVTQGDFNGDGRVDLAVANVQGNNLSVLLGNGNGDFAGQVYSIIDLPTVTAPTATLLSTTSVLLGGNVTSDGSSPITERGFVYALTSSNANPQIGGPGVTQVVSNGTTGPFTANVNGLTNQAVYSFASYATNGVGTSYTTPATTFGVNLPPVLSGIETTPLPYKANDPAFPPLPISNTFAVTDADSNNLTKLTVQITAGYQHDANGQDLLAFTSKYGITGSFDSSSGTLTLSGTAYAGVYREALRTVTFSSSGTKVTGNDRTLTIIASDDGAPSPAVSLPITRTVTVLTINVPPTLSSVATTPLPYVLGSVPAAVAPAANIVDADSINLAGATIQITANYQSGLDVLSADTTGTGITATFDASSGTLNLAGIASLATYQAVLRSATYSTNSITGSTALRTLTFLLNDGVASSTPVTRLVHVLPFNYPPLVSGIESSPLVYKANDSAFPPLPISGTVTVTDPDSDNLSMLTVQITSGYQHDANGQDVLSFTDKYGITGSFDAATGTLTLSGTAYVGDYREALRTVTFNSTGTNVSNANRILTIIATDDGLPTVGVSQPVTRTVVFNFPPVVTGIEPSRLVYVANSPPEVVSNTVEVTDPDSDNLTKVTVQITSGYQHDFYSQDVLSFTSQFGINGSFDIATGTLTLSGTAYVGFYREVLRSVNYSSSGTNVSTADRIITIIATDDGSPQPASSFAVTRTLAALNRPPVIGGIESSPMGYVANNPPQAISNTVTLTDVDSNNLTKLTVQISSGYQNDANGQDVLSFTDSYGIHGSFNAATGTLTLTGTAYIGDYREALRLVKFSSTGTNVLTADRILTIIATDDGSPNPGVSAAVQQTVTVSL